MVIEYPANSNEVIDNVVLPFVIDKPQIPGYFIRMNTEIHNILSGHKYPLCVSQILGELLALTAIIGNCLNLDGILSIQTRSNGPVGFLTADYTDEGNLRAVSYTHLTLPTSPKV